MGRGGVSFIDFSIDVTFGAGVGVGFHVGVQRNKHRSDLSHIHTVQWMISDISSSAGHVHAVDGRPDKESIESLSI